MNSAIRAEIEEQCPQSLPTEKRKHAGVGDGSPQSKPIPPEKRSCVENVELLPEFLPEQNLCECKAKKKGEYVAPTFDELPPYDQKRLMRFRERFGPDWPKSAIMRSHNRSDELIGDLGNFYEDEDQKENRLGSALKEENIYVCPNPFEPLNFKENDGLYSELRVFAEKAVPYCNAIFKTSLCFEDIEKVTSCQSDCNHHLVTIKVADPCDKMSVVVLRGRVRSGGFAEAKVQDFVILGAYKP